VHSLKYVLARHWLRAHTTLAVLVVVAIGVAIYLIAR
jgi:hypothetical protein